MISLGGSSIVALNPSKILIKFQCTIPDFRIIKIMFTFIQRRDPYTINNTLFTFYYKMTLRSLFLINTMNKIKF